MTPHWLDSGLAGQPYPGEPESGDAALVIEFERGALIAVIDGLGHGPEAARASKRAIERLSENPARSPSELIAACDDALKRLRGAVMSLASLDGLHGELTWLGVGNVEGAFFRAAEPGSAPERLLGRGGIVGQRAGGLHPATLQVSRGDVLVFATDGLPSNFIDRPLRESIARGEPVETIARELLARQATGRDDALVLVVRFRGAAS